MIELSKAASNRVVDAHLHVWDTAEVDIPWIRRAGLPARADIPEARAACILVEADAADPVQETDWLLGLWRSRPEVLGVVAGVDLLHRGAEERLGVLARTEGVVGVRQVLQDRSDAELEAAFTALVALRDTELAVDVCVRSHQLRHCADLLGRMDGQRVVLDHLGKPPLADSAGLKAWREDLTAVAAHGQVRVKLSGLPAEADLAAADPEHSAALLDEHTAPLLETALELFGPERCMVGTDAPVSQDPRGWMARAHEVLEHLLTPDELRQVEAETATGTYRRCRGAHL